MRGREGEERDVPRPIADEHQRDAGTPTTRPNQVQGAKTAEVRGPMGRRRLTRRQATKPSGGRHAEEGRREDREFVRGCGRGRTGDLAEEKGEVLRGDPRLVRNSVECIRLLPSLDRSCDSR